LVGVRNGAGGNSGVARKQPPISLEVTPPSTILLLPIPVRRGQEAGGEVVRGVRQMRVR